MKINLIILLVIFVLAGSWALYHNSAPPQFNQNHIDENQNIEYLTAPDFEFTDMNGVSGRLHDNEGKAILLHFWATWCAPCLVEFPELIALAQKTPEDLTVLAISTDHRHEDIKRFLNGLALNIPDNVKIIYDVDKSITQDMFQTFKLPETYLIDKQSRILKKLIGPQENWNSEEWIHKIESVQSF